MRFRNVLVLIALVLTAPVMAQETRGPMTRITDYTLRQWSLDFREYETEVISCMYGEDQGIDLTVVFGVHADVTPSASTPDSVRVHRTGGCVSLQRFRLFGLAHNHPSGACHFSGPDLTTFNGNQYDIIVTVCGVDRFLIMRRGWPRALCAFDSEADPVTLDCREVVPPDGG